MTFRKIMGIAIALVGLLLANTAFAQSYVRPQFYDNSGTLQSISSSNPLPVAPQSYGFGAAAITGNATGTTGAVVGTLAAVAAKTTYICGFNISAVGGTATVGPIVVAGLIGSSQTYQLNSAAIPVQLSQSFNPCIPASAANTAITITTTADGSASAVDVNSWGYQQ